ncbi:MAG: DMT family transporter, partial [Planctomycetota bacterium]
MVKAPSPEPAPLSRRTAYGYLLIAALLWSTGGVVIKLVDWNSFALAGVRSGISGLLLWIYLRRPRFRWSAPELGGAVFYAATVISFVAATKMTTAGSAIALQFTAPIWVALLSKGLLGEPVKRRDWQTIGVVLAGLCLFFWGDLSTRSLWGNSVALLSGVCFAGRPSRARGRDGET